MISWTLAKHLHLPRIEITFCDLAEVNITVKDAIKHVSYADIDIDDYKLKRVFFYVVPNQEDDVILG